MAARRLPRSTGLPPRSLPTAAWNRRRHTSPLLADGLGNPGLEQRRKKTPAAKAEWSAAARRAAGWLLTVRGRPIGPSDVMEEGRPVYGHDTTLQGWPWVEGTHSWVEPTAISLLALRSAGRAGHPHCREAVKLLLDRQLPAGGWNFGNTTVFGHVLRPQVQPTGLALAALAGEADIRPKVQGSLDFSRTTLSRRTTAASLGYALMGLAGHGCGRRRRTTGFARRPRTLRHEARRTTWRF